MIALQNKLTYQDLSKIWNQITIIRSSSTYQSALAFCVISRLFQELALAKGLSPQEAQEQGALAAAALGAETLSLAERQANLKRSIALREELVAKAQEIQEEYEEEKSKRDEMVLERIDLELELETETRICEKKFLARKRMVEKPIVTQLMPGVSVSSVDLLCLRSELTVQKELAEQEVSQSCSNASSSPSLKLK